MHYTHLYTHTFPSVMIIHQGFTRIMMSVYNYNTIVPYDTTYHHMPCIPRELFGKPS